MIAPDISTLIPFFLLAVMLGIIGMMVMVAIAQIKKERWMTFVICLSMIGMAVMMFIDCVGMLVTQSATGWFR